MSNIPKPFGSLPPPPPRQTNRELPPPPPKPPETPPPVPPVLVISHPGTADESKLSEDEVSYILRTTLRPDQHSNPKVVRFIMAYMQCRSVSQAADEAGYSSSQGTYWRSRPEIHLAIEKLTQKAVQKYGYDASEIVERVKEIGTFDPVEFENPDGSYKTHLSQIRPEARRAIKKFKVKNIYGLDPNGMKIVIGQIMDIEVWDKLKSLEYLGREKDLFKETRKVEHDVTANMASVLLESKRRADQRSIEGSIDVTPSGRGDGQEGFAGYIEGSTTDDKDKTDDNGTGS